MNKQIKLYLIIAVIILLLIIFLQNTEVVRFKILFWNIAMSRIILFLGTLFVGFVSGYLVGKMPLNKSDNKESK